MPEFSLISVINKKLRDQPNRELLTFCRRSLPPLVIRSKDLSEQLDQQIRTFRSAGMKPRQLVIIWMDHGWPTCLAFLAVMGLGAIPTIRPYPNRQRNAASCVQSMRALIRRTRASWLMSTDNYSDLVNSICEGLRCKNWIFEELESYSDVELQSDPKRIEAPISRFGDDTAFVQFSSGTTGSPKGVLLSHRAVLNQIKRFAAALPFDQRDTNVSALPLFHDMGLITQLLMPLACGARSVLLDPSHWALRPSLLLQAVSDHGGTMTWMPNFGFRHCVRGIRSQEQQSFDLSTWRIVGNGSEPIDPKCMSEFSERFASSGLDPAALRSGYGLAETVLSATVSPPNTPLRVDRIRHQSLLQHGRAELASVGEPAFELAGCGYPTEGTSIRIVDAKGSSMPERCVGEIVLRSSSRFSGYMFEKAHSTKAVHHGWLHSGDLGYLAEGELFVCGRFDDQIISGGMKLCPESIEREVSKLVGKSLAAVVTFGVWNSDLGTQSVIAILELSKQRDETTRSQIAKNLREQIHNAMGVRLYRVLFVRRGWICRSTSYKLARSETRRKYLSELESKLTEKKHLWPARQFT